MTMPPLVRVLNIRPEERPTLYGPPGLSFDIGPGEFVVILGKSGDGKSTILETILGTRRPHGGSVSLFDGSLSKLVVQSPGAGFFDRNIGITFQDGALFERLTVRRNWEFVLRTRRVDRTLWNGFIEGLARDMRLESQLNQEVSTLSGGQKQRAALGRMLIVPRNLYLFDEPLASVDNPYRQRMMEWLVRFRQRLQEDRKAAIYVTHNQQEALALATRILLLRREPDSHEKGKGWHGGIQQDGKPEDIYWKPRTTFVAKFVGDPLFNLIPVSWGGEMLLNESSLLSLLHSDSVSRFHQLQDGGSFAIGFRPEVARLTQSPKTRLSLRVVLEEQIFQGEEIIWVCRDQLTGNDVRVQLHSTDAPRAVDRTEHVLHVSDANLILFWYPKPAGYNKDDDDDICVGLNVTHYPVDSKSGQPSWAPWEPGLVSQ